MSIRSAIGLLGAVLLAAGCGTTPPSPPPPPTPATSSPTASSPTASETPSTSPAAATPAPESAATPPAQTDPQRLDAVLIRPEELPGWQASPAATDHAEVRTEPAECRELYYQAPGKVANPMGSSVAYSQGDARELRQVADLVDSGTQTVDQVAQMLGRCARFTVIEDATKIPVTVTPLDGPAPSDRAQMARFTLGTNPTTDVVVIWSGHKDVLLTTAVQGASVDQRIAIDAATTAYQRLRDL